MATLSLVVLISGNGSNLQAIMDACEQGLLHAKVVGVISNKADAMGLQRAQRQHIPSVVVASQQATSRAEYDQQLLQAIEKFSPQLVVLAGFMRILSPFFVQHFRGRIINIHPSLLPKHRGLHTHRQVLQQGDEEHGVSIHFVTEELDGGPIISQARFKVQADDDEARLQQRVHTLEHQMYPRIIEWIAQGQLQLDNGQVFLDQQPLPACGYQFSVAANGELVDHSI